MTLLRSTAERLGMSRSAEYWNCRGREEKAVEDLNLTSLERG